MQRAIGRIEAATCPPGQQQVFLIDKTVPGLKLRVTSKPKWPSAGVPHRAQSQGSRQASASPPCAPCSATPKP